ncbi:hypothetical protein QVD17_05256 [Tagetes erecta]|uniref:Uncharacterized protein n=1 Tax=Tagetes erecta TaxID=13708 RepID=A0AAD8LE24_TARER|nr:hypothetical protein QVD17_05256 [Tagetes erecta]
MYVGEYAIFINSGFMYMYVCVQFQKIKMEVELEPTTTPKSNDCGLWLDVTKNESLHLLIFFSVSTV